MKTTEVIQPTTMVGALAYGGTKNTIPASATGTNNASITEGFPELTQLPVSQGGLPPERADFNGMFYLSTDQRVFLQNGGVITFSEDVSTAIGGYPKNAVLAYFDEKGGYHLAQSLIDDNTYNFVESPEYLDGIHWQKINMGGSSRNIGEIVTSTLPLTDAGLHLLDGSLLQGGGIYNSFVSYIKNLYEINSTASYFATEEAWQASVSTSGVCGKYVYNPTDNTVRLPKITGLIEGTVDANALGQLVKAGLPALSVSTVGDHLHTGTTDWAGDHYHDRGNMEISGNLNGVLVGGDGAFYYSYDANWNTSNASWTAPLSKLYEFRASRTWTGVTNTTGAHTHTFTSSTAGAHTHTLSGNGLGNSDTVQPQTVKAFVYVVVATSVKEDIVVDIDNIATDLNAKADKADTANNSLSNLTAEGEKHFLNKTQTSNCILEVPQRIKLEFLNGVLTLKAGSQLLQPDGLEADGITKKFKYRTIDSDMVFPGVSPLNTYAGKVYIYARNDMANLSNFVMDYVVPDNTSSGSAAPASAWDYHVFYNTAENKLYLWDGSAWRSDLDIAFPIGDMTINGVNITSLDNVYNTVSGLANSLIVKEGVKLLIPNGMNADGTLNNIEYIVNKNVSVQADLGSNQINWVLMLTSLGEIYLSWFQFCFYQTEAPVVESYVGAALWYNPSTNISTLYLNGVPQQIPITEIVRFTTDLGFVRSIAQHTVTNFLKYNDKSVISGWGMPSTRYASLTVAGTATAYTAPANGWFVIDGVDSAGLGANGVVVLRNQTTRLGAMSFIGSGSNGGYINCTVPVLAGDIVNLFYEGAITTANITLKFVYAKGEDY